MFKVFLVFNMAFNKNFVRNNAENTKKGVISLIQSPQEDS